MAALELSKQNSQYQQCAASVAALKLRYLRYAVPFHGK
jgi:hypothetical protein